MMEENYQAKISPRNKAFAEKLRGYAKEYSILGVVDVEGLPAPQFQRIRASLKSKAEIVIVKKNILELVLCELEKSHPGVGALVQKAQGVVGLIFTNHNPFTLYKTAKKSKSSAPAKAGAVAPKDIVVPAGPTSFSPGPIIGELGAFKIKAGINAGKVEIKEDSVVAKEGEVLSSALAGILTRLGIEPMEVGLNIKAMYEEGTLFDKNTLDVDDEAILADLKNEAARSSALALGLVYPTKENAPLFLAKAAQESFGLAMGMDYPAAETIKNLIVKAQAQGSSVGSSLPEDLRPAGMTVAVAAAAPVADTQDASANEASNSEEKSEEQSDEDSAAGLGSLF